MARRQRRRAPRGQGSVYPDPASGGYIAAVPWPGRKHPVKRRAATRPAADALRRELIVKRDAQIDPADAAQPIRQWASYVLNTAKAGNKGSTRDKLRQSLEWHILPFFGDYSLERVRGLLIEQWLIQMRRPDKAGRVLAESTVYRVYQHLAMLFGLAVMRGVITRNPCNEIRDVLPKRPHTEKPPLSDAEVQAFIAAARGHRLEALFLFALVCGARQGETLGLEWKDVDLDAGTIHIRRQINQKGKTDTLKTDASERVLPLPPHVLAAFRARLEAQRGEYEARGLSWTGQGVIFTAVRSGKRIWPSNLRDQFYHVRERAGLSGEINFHLTRTTAASRLADLGYSILLIGAVLGHSKKTVTEKYVTVSMDARRAALTAVERGIFGGDVEQERKTK